MPNFITTKEYEPLIINPTESIKSGVWTGAKGLSGKDQQAVTGITSGFPFSQTFKAGMRINKGEACFMYTDGLVYSTDAVQASMVTGYVGIAVSSATKGGGVSVQTFGIVDLFTGLTTQSEYYLSNATQNTDQSQATQDTYAFLGTSEVNYQSFTTGAAVIEISKVQLGLNTGGGSSTRNITIRIREGNGLGGASLGTVTVSTTIDATPTFKDFIFDLPIVLSPSTQYTISALYSTGGGSGTPAWSYANGTNPYAGGEANAGGPPAANSDYMFKTFYTTNRGAIGTGAGTVSKKVGFSTSAKSLTLKDSI